MFIINQRYSFLKVFFIASFLLLFIGVAGQAAGVTSIVDTANTNYREGTYGLNDFVYLAIRISNIILGLIGSLSLAVFIYAGFLLMLSGGSSDKVGQAKKAIVAAVIGIIITLGSYTIIQFAMKAMGANTWNGTIQKIT